MAADPGTPSGRRAPLASRYYAPGEVIAGKYELVRPLGEGGMGSVWFARNLALEADVALKLIRAEVDAEDAGDRLLQEARAAARLGHRAICRVFDFGHTDPGDPFIVMELLDGESLGAVLQKRGRLSALKAVQTLLPVIDALSVAHRRGIVHRDLKPDNVFIARDGDRTQPKVVDFGIAKMEMAQGRPRRTLTRQGTVLGSPGYMAPEQAKGLTSVDYHADIWAISVVLYECVTGRPAFEGENYNALMRSIIEDPVIPTTELAAGDAGLWEVLRIGLEKDPSARWASMREMGAALAEWLLSHGMQHDITGDGLGRWFDEATTVEGRDALSDEADARDSQNARQRLAPPERVTLDGAGRAAPGASERSSDGIRVERHSDGVRRTPVDGRARRERQGDGSRPSGPASTSAVVRAVSVAQGPGRRTVIAASAAGALLGVLALAALFGGDAEGTGTRDGSREASAAEPASERTAAGEARPAPEPAVTPAAPGAAPAIPAAAAAPSAELPTAAADVVPAGSKEATGAAKASGADELAPATVAPIRPRVAPPRPKPATEKKSPPAAPAPGPRLKDPY